MRHVSTSHPVFPVDRQVGPDPVRDHPILRGTNQIQRLVIARPVQRLAATGRAKYVPDAAVIDGVQRHGDAERHTPTMAPTSHPRSAPFLQRGGSRIRTLEGISRRIYSPLPAILKRRRTLKSPACAPITIEPHAPMTAG
jgi:hypothetical protein